MAENQPVDLLVVGGGIIGLAVAWSARARGLSVTVLERDLLGAGTSRVAAGMLAPVAEVEFGAAGQRVLDLGLRSAALWPAFAARLRDAAGVDVGLLRSGTLIVARDEDEALELERQLAFRQSLGLAVRRLRPSEARGLEPALAPTLRMALEAPEDHSVDPRAVLDALARACRASGVELREHARVAAVECDGAGTRVSGVRLHGGELLGCAHAVLATGAWSGELDGLPGGVGVPVRPVKGQILRLRDPAGAGMLSRVVRYEGGYLLPRADGRYILGATVEERGFELAATAGGVHDLLRDARELVPGVRELEIEELCVGLRPGTPDNAPLIGAAGVEGLWWATGHHRNGILLAPLTARLLLGLLDADAREDDADALLELCDPLRFRAGRGAADGPERACGVAPSATARATA